MIRFLKSLLSLLFIFLTTQLFAQKGDRKYFINSLEYQPWELNDFITHKVRKIEAYKCRIRKNGKLGFEKLLLFRKVFVADSNKIYGINSYTSFSPGEDPHLNFEMFEAYYNEAGNVIKKVAVPNARSKKEIANRATDNFRYRDETFYEYDSLNKLVKETTYELRYEIRDMQGYQLISIHPKFYEYFYNEHGLETKRYYTDDSTQYLGQETEKPQKTCILCESRFLECEKTYTSEGKLKLKVIYESDGIVETKYYLAYDSAGRITQGVDSTGWNLKDNKPYRRSTTVYEYDETGKTVTRIYNTKKTNGISKKVMRYDGGDRLMNECSGCNDTTKCTTTTYSYSGNKLIASIKTDDKGNVTKQTFSYNSKGLLTVDRMTYNGSIQRVFKYKYQY